MNRTARTRNSTHCLKIKLSAAAILIALAVFLSSCGAIRNLDVEYYDNLLVSMLNDIKNNDQKSVRTYLSGDYSMEDINAGMKEIQDIFKGEIESAKRVGFNYNKHVNNAGSLEQYTLTYLVHTDTYQYAAVLLIYVKDGGAPELVGLRVVPADQAFDQGRILDFSNFNIVQALLILLSVASTGIIILAMVLCVKAKIRYKALWILAILLFQSGFKLSLMPNSFRFNVNIIAISLSSLRTFINGSSILTVILPLGAILFLILRKSLIRGAVRHAEKNQAASAAMDATGNPDAGDGEQYHHDSGNSNNG